MKNRKVASALMTMLLTIMAAKMSRAADAAVGAVRATDDYRGRMAWSSAWRRTADELSLSRTSSSSSSESTRRRRRRLPPHSTNIATGEREETLQRNLAMLLSLSGGSTASSFRSGGGKTPHRLPPTSPFRKTTTTTTTSAWQQQQQRQQREEAADDDDDGNRQVAKEMMDAFLTRDSRNSFISRVYAILSAQLIVTALSVTAFGTNPAIGRWMRQQGLGAAVPSISLLVSTVSWLVMASSVSARRKSPLKWQLLALFTAGESVSVGFITSMYRFQSVAVAMAATAVASTAVSLYTVAQRNPKYDLSQWGATLSSWGFIFLVYGLIQLLQMTGVLPANFLPYHDTVYCLAGALLFSLYLAYHTKLVVAGKHAKYQMNEQDYVFGAMTLYNDIINMFIYTLRMIGEDKD